MSRMSIMTVTCSEKTVEVLKKEVKLLLFDEVVS